jgi:hypothetical protein
VSTLNLNDYTPAATAPLTGDKLEIAKQVKTLGTVALIVAIVGLCVPFLGVVSLFLSKRAFNISRKNLTPVEYEGAAMWAYRLSLLSIVLSVLGIIRLIFL